MKAILLSTVLSELDEKLTPDGKQKTFSIKFVKKKEEFLKVLKEIEVKHIEFEINEFKLMESKLSKDGSKYIVLKEYKT